MSAEGIDFPADADGKRTTTAVNQGAFIAAVRQWNPQAFQDVSAEPAKKWRFGYAKHVVKQVQAAACSEQAALGIAEDGLAFIHSKMEFIRDGKAEPLKDAMSKYVQGSFESTTITGSQPKGTAGLEVPYRGTTLRGDALRAQVEAWVRKGIIELDTGAALCQVVSNPGWLDLSDSTFVLFGAGSAMGPFPLLMALGAHVVAIDLPRPQIWSRLLAIARGSPGKLTIPLTKRASSDSDADIAQVAGCDLLRQTPEVRNWLLTLQPDARFVLGGYCYADGPLFVKVSTAMDAIISDLVEKRKVKPALAYLCTPTDAHFCTASAVDAAKQNLRKAAWWQPLLSSLLGFAKMGLAPNRLRQPEGELPICDAIVKEQGPNYCLAKRIQHWRCVLARKKGCIVSSNIAPSTSTASVVSNASFALAYKGMHHFKPMEIFAPETSNSVMTALLVNDLRNPLSAANPATSLENPMQLFAATAFHGGAWRLGYKFGTIGPSSVTAYLITYGLSKLWLPLYNIIQLVGWCYAAFAMRDGLQAPVAAGTIAMMTYFQLAEVLHAALGIVPSSPVTTAMQIASRVGLVQVLACGIDDANRKSAEVWQGMFFIAWTITECVRYSYYILQNFNLEVKPLTWLRYSTFLVLYPLGVTGELGTVYVALPAMAAKNVSLAAAGCSLSGACGIFPVLVSRLGFVGMLVVYAACFPMLFGAMLAQRKKVLARGKVPNGKKAD